MAAEYPELPQQILHDITKRISFGPWMILAETQNTRNKKDKDLQKLSNLITGEFHHVDIPEFKEKRYLGSFSGWCLTRGAKIHIFNPLTRQRILLPSRKKLPHNQDFGYYDCDTSPMLLYRFALSGRKPKSGEVIVMVIYSIRGKLAFASPESESWTPIESQDFFHDVIFFNGKFYGVTSYGGLRVCNNLTSLPETIIEQLEFKHNHSWKFYLFEMSGKLYLLKRTFETKAYRCVSTRFQVYKLDNKKWTIVSDLERNAVFIGMSSSFSVSTCDYPNLKSNCIYFMDNEDWYKPGEDTGIYDYKERKFENIYKKDCPAAFFKPSFV